MAKKCVICGNKVGMMEGTPMFGGQICLTCNAKIGNLDSMERATLADAVKYFDGFQSTMEPEAAKGMSHDLAAAKDRLELLPVGDDGRFLETPVEDREKIAVTYGNRMLIMTAGAFVFSSGREEQTIPFSQIISLRIVEPKNTLTNGSVSLVLGGSSDSFVHLTSWLTVGSNNNVSFPLMYAQIEEAREMSRRFNAYHQSQVSPSTPAPAGESIADEIRKYKELLDMGALTEEEFVAAKKKLLGL